MTIAIDPGREGKIVTFYSFKGGVGRTMALANIAFLAAANGKKVLMMDWDLEAPGLLYYFRSQMDVADYRAARESRGILDIVNEWSEGSKSNDEGVAKALLRRFESGEVFEESACGLLGYEWISGGAALDYIGAGAQSIGTDSPRSYEQVLSEFSWANFINKEAGGIALNALRKWAKRNYDFIFLDSRTGFADVAGICTMQLPDLVSLCFIFNRQNIEGVARAASAIRHQRNEEVKVRAVPMRVTRSGTPEEVDAKARAASELVRTGGFSSDGAKEDFEKLSIHLSEGLPFYETIAPIVAVSRKLDLLTLNYTSAASELLGIPLEVPELDEDVIATARRRLQPRQATIEYVSKLKTFDSQRAIGELQMLLESALESILDGSSQDDDYILALVTAAIATPETFDQYDEGGQIREITLEVLRAMLPNDPEMWRPLLVEAMQRYVEYLNLFSESDEALVILEELDSLLAQTQSTSNRILRLEYRRRVAAIYLGQDNTDGALQIVGEIHSLLEEIAPVASDLSKDQQLRVFASTVDKELILADVAHERRNGEEALSRYSSVLEKIQLEDKALDAAELRGFVYRVNFRLATSGVLPVPKIDRATYALGAARSGGAKTVLNFLSLASAIDDSQKSQVAIDFLEATLNNPSFKRQKLFSYYFGRGTVQANAYLEQVSHLVKLAERDGPIPVELISGIVESVAVVLMSVRRRQTTAPRDLNSRNGGQFSQNAVDILQQLESVGGETGEIHKLVADLFGVDPNRSIK